MAPPTPPPLATDPEATSFLDDAFLDVLDAIDMPALVFLPGGRVAAVNRAMARLPGPPAAGDTMDEIIHRYRARRADGTPIVRSDLPYVRALRGEVVFQGERFEMTFDDGTVYRTLITATPVVVDRTVIAALSVWHDFGALVRDLAERSRE